MKTDIKDLAALLAAIIWIDNTYDESELATVEEIAEAFQLPTDQLLKAVDDAVAATKDLDEKALNDALDKAAAKVPQEERAPIYEALIQMALCDNVLTLDEADNLMSLAASLSLTPGQATILLCDMVKDTPEIEVIY